MSKHRFGRLLMMLGALLVLCSAGFVFYNVRADRTSGAAAAAALTELQLLQPAVSAAEQETLILDAEQEMPSREIEEDYYIGTVSAPAADIDLPVMSEWNYTKLKTAPCRYTGSVYTSDMVICGHNYASHFGKLSSLCVGDAVTFTDMGGNKWEYAVSELEVIDKFDVDAMTSGSWDLTLFTCTVGGAQRVAVRCVAENEK